MLSQSELLERLEIQKQDLIGLLFEDPVAEILAGKPPSIKIPRNLPPESLAVPFSDDLMLCPSIEAAKSCVQKDPLGALAFIKAAEVAIEKIENGSIHLAPRRREVQTPFFLLASLVQECSTNSQEPPAQ